MEKILVTPRSYGKTNPALFEQLAEAGYEVVRNDVGGIFTKEQMIERIAPCVGVIIGVDPMDADVIAAAPKLRAISKYGVGVDNIDLDAAKARGIPVSRAVGANSEAVADYAFALMLALSRKVLPIDAKCRKDDWSKVTTLDVSHKTLGIFGMGAIGKHVARRAQGFSMKIMAYDVYWDEAFSKEHGVVRAEPEEIFKTCDFISLHLPLLAVQPIGGIYQCLLIRLGRFSCSLGVKQLGEFFCCGITCRFQLFKSIQRAFITAQLG